MSYADDGIPEVFRAERQREIGEALPTQITIDVSPGLAVILRAQAISNDRAVEYVARRQLELWAEKAIREAQRLAQLIHERGIELSALGPNAPREERVSEADYKRQLAASIEVLGFRVVTELDTGAGDADIAVYRDGTTEPVGIIEVKVSLAKWRDCHHATGQAQAYAKAAGAPLWWVVAADIEPRLLSAQVLLLDEAAAKIVEAVKAGPPA